MTVAEDLFTRILAMDSYFRGPLAPGVLPEGNSSIGDAQFNGDDLLPASAPAEGFYAADWAGQATPTEVNWFPGIGLDVLADPDLAIDLRLAGSEHGDDTPARRLTPHALRA